LKTTAKGNRTLFYLFIYF